MKLRKGPPDPGERSAGTLSAFPLTLRSGKLYKDWIQINSGPDLLLCCIFKFLQRLSVCVFKRCLKNIKHLHSLAKSCVDWHLPLEMDCTYLPIAESPRPRYPYWELQEARGTGGFGLYCPPPRAWNQPMTNLSIVIVRRDGFGVSNYW